jgi:hypothetical protein
MQGLTKACVIFTTAVTICAPARARADGYVSPWIGIHAVDRNDDGRGTFGVTAGYMGGGVFGFEGDLGYSADFFGPSQIGEGYAINVMGNFILGVPIGGDHGAGVRPFVTGGLGLLRTHIDAGRLVNVSLSSNDFAYDVGAGMMGFFNEHFGLRGEVRYLRTLQDTNRGSGIDFENGRLRFWRATAGVTFR